MEYKEDILRQTSLETLSIIDELPTLPDRFVKIKAILEDSESTLDDLTAIIQTDQSTSATLLKAANSSFYNPLGAPVSNLPYAISRLGRKETGDIALSISLLYGFSIPAHISTIRSFWTSAFVVAQISRWISTRGNHSKILNPDTIFMAALLHDIGRVILSMRIDMAYFEKGFSTTDEQALVSEERKHYGIDHAEAGGIVLQQWGLSSEIYSVVADHYKDDSDSIDVKICRFADEFTRQHLSSIISIEDAQALLKEGLLEQALTEFNQQA